jgi:hypothetical protein
LSLFGLFTQLGLNSTRIEFEILIPKKVYFLANGDVVPVVLIVIVNNPCIVLCFNRRAGCK